MREALGLQRPFLPSEIAMELTPGRQRLIDAHVAETRTRMADHAFELNDLVRFALSAARQRDHKVYHPMDPVNECVRHWHGLSKKIAALTARIERDRERLGVPPFDAESPPANDPSNPSDA